MTYAHQGNPLGGTGTGTGGTGGFGGTGGTGGTGGGGGGTGLGPGFGIGAPLTMQLGFLSQDSWHVLINQSWSMTPMEHQVKSR
jgi:hypothetical protein